MSYNVVNVTQGLLLSSSVNGEVTGDSLQIGTPGNPAAGRDRLYFKNDDNLYKLTSAGVESQVGTAPVTSVSNSDGTLTISPTTGDVVASLNLAHANVWTATQTVPNLVTTGGIPAAFQGQITTLWDTQASWAFLNSSNQSIILGHDEHDNGGHDFFIYDHNPVSGIDFIPLYIKDGLIGAGLLTPLANVHGYSDDDARYAIIAQGKLTTVDTPGSAGGSFHYQSCSCSDPQWGDQGSCEGAGHCALPQYDNQGDCEGNGGTWDGAQCLLPADDNNQSQCETDGGTFNSAGNTWSCDPSSTGYTAMGNVHAIRVYAYKNTSPRVFSPSYATATVTDDSSGNPYNVDWSWAAVSGADGYIVFKSLNGSGYTTYYDVGSSTDFEDDNSQWSGSPPDVSLTSLQTGIALESIGPATFTSTATLQPLISTLFLATDGSGTIVAASLALSQFTNDSGYITDGSLSASSPLSYNGAGQFSLTTVPVNKGGTNLTSYAVGDLLYASGATTLSKLADVATGNALISGGVTTAPSWGKIGLTTHISGTLAVGNGGTGVTALSNILGTSNQVSVASGTARVIGGDVTLSLPQNIHTGATPTFAGLTLSGLESINYTASGFATLTNNSLAVGYGGNYRFNVSSEVFIGATSSGIVPLRIVGKQSQSARYFSIEDSLGNDVTYVDPTTGLTSTILTLNSVGGGLYLVTGDQIQIHKTGGGSNGDLTIVNNTTGVTQLYLTSTGKVGIGNLTSPGAQLEIDTTVATNKGLIVKGFASQTADLSQWQASDGSVAVKIDSALVFWAMDYNIVCYEGDVVTFEEDVLTYF